ncbi:MAG: hypothetical protein H6656_20680 [Ardenticatenaceae bacterium]|nr:hypothetical protein [Ardenticatenaceae bacterium]
MRKRLFMLSLVCLITLVACTTPRRTPSLAVPVATEVLPTATPDSDLVEVTRVIGTAEPTATAAPCTPLLEGMRLTIRSDDGLTIHLEVEGLLPDDKPTVLLKGTAINQTSARETFPGNPVGPNGRYQDSYYLGNELGDIDIVNWTGQIIHQRGAICFEFTLPLTEPVMLEAQPTPTATAVPNQETTWAAYQSDTLQLTLQHPHTWQANERDGFLYLMSPERYSFGDNDPQQLIYYVYASVFPNPEHKPFEEVVTADLGEELQQIFSYTTETIGAYTVYRTTKMPSAEGALTVFFAAEDRFISLALTPYRPEDPFEAQDQYVQLFEQMLTSVQLLDHE